MTLKEKFNNIEIMFEGQIGSLEYDELCEASNQCEQIAEEFAIGFAEWFRDYQWTGNDETIKQLLEIYKKEKGL